jgi:hypothetical protein
MKGLKRQWMKLKRNVVHNHNINSQRDIVIISKLLDEIATVLLDDKIMRKGDRVFWITTEKTLAPGRILEMRKMSSINSHNNCHFAIIKLVNITFLKLFI